MTLNAEFTKSLEDTIEQLKRDRVYKRLNYLDSPQSSRVKMEGRGDVLILSSNNYLGLCDEPAVVAGGDRRTQATRRGDGERALHLRYVHDPPRARGRRAPGSSAASRRSASSRRGTRTKDSPATVAQEGDFIVSDALNHASIIDSMRLAKAIASARRAVFKHGDMDDLRAKLAEAKGVKRRMIWTDGIFSMEGAIAKLPEILQIARDTNSIVAVDDSHATGVLGKNGRGTAEHYGVLGEVDIITSTLGKALGGAAGGFVAGPEALTDYLTQRSRPQLFSNALPPTVAASALAAVRLVEAHPERVETLRQNTSISASRSRRRGSSRLPGETPIVPIIVGETAAAIQMSDMLLDEGRVRHRVWISRRAARDRSRAVPDLGGAYARRSRRGDSRVQEGWRKAGAALAVEELRL